PSPVVAGSAPPSLTRGRKKLIAGEFGAELVVRYAMIWISLSFLKSLISVLSLKKAVIWPVTFDRPEKISGTIFEPTTGSAVCVKVWVISSEVTTAILVPSPRSKPLTAASRPVVAAAAGAVKNGAA